jgi:ribonuclease HII
MTNVKPHYDYEYALEGTVCGIDEAGRGALAGGVFAAAVTLHVDRIPDGLNDSKKLTKVNRTRLAHAIFSCADVGVGVASAVEIDALNILQASMLAMQRAYAALTHPPLHALIDGNRAPDLPCQAQCIIKGDTLSLSIAAASIIAKVLRDDAMHALHAVHPQYHFDRHAGYGTALHLQALRLYGATAQHRQSFRPVRECIL